MDLEHNEMHGNNGKNTADLLQNAFSALEIGDWLSANASCDQVLAAEPENSQAHLGKLLAELKVQKKEDLQNCKKPFDDRESYKCILRYADDKLVGELSGYITHIISQSKLRETPSKPQRDMTNLKVYLTTGVMIISICAVIAVVMFTWIIPGFQNGSKPGAEPAVATQPTYENVPEYIWDRLDSGDELVSADDTAWDEVAQRNSICIAAQHTMALQEDGTVVAVGDNGYGQCNVEEWTSIIDICADGWHSVGLRSDGTLVATGLNSSGQCDVSNWYDIVSVSVGVEHTVALKSDGTVMTTGLNIYGQCDVDYWYDIIAISASDEHTVGLRDDGTVVATGNNEDGRCNVSTWTDIVAICADNTCTVGLKADGTVVVTGDVPYDCSDWTDITAISTGDAHIVGLKNDGTVVALGDNQSKQCNVADWTDIVAIAAGTHHTLGLKSDGTVVALGFGQSSIDKISKWTNIKLP